MSTLDHLTRGRIGWNIVTGHQASAARALGQELAAHDDRYAIADDFMEAVYKLWEGSWDDDAVRVDRERRIFADPAGIRVQRHAGRTTAMRARTCPNPRRSARRCYIRPAPPAGASASPPRTPNACS